MPELFELGYDDLDAVAELERQTFSRPWSKAMYADEIENKNSYHWVVKENGAVVGYFGFRKIFDEGEITNIAVKMEYRRKGYGGYIMRTIAEKASQLGIAAMWLEVRIGNAAARRLYERYGYIAVNVRKKYYWDGEDAVIYRAEFEESYH